MSLKSITVSAYDSMQEQTVVEKFEGEHLSFRTDADFFRIHWMDDRGISHMRALRLCNICDFSTESVYNEA